MLHVGIHMRKECYSMSKNREQPIIELKNLKKYFDIAEKGKLHAVDDISFTINAGETVGLVGESGCGKSTVGNVIMRLLSATSGEVLYRGKNIFDASNKKNMELYQKMQIIFQDPYSSLNPKKTILQILSEPYKIHHLISSKKELKEKIDDLLDMCGIESYVLEKYPHELDGGRRQLIGIARALSLNPEFIVCDEPVSSLDVSIQATIINLLMRLQKEKNISYLFISHDLSVVRHISDVIVVMYLGQIVEWAPVDELFKNPRHPYSIALLSAIPKIADKPQENSIVLKGDVMSPINPKPGCRFISRCWMVSESCKGIVPELKEISPGHYVRCPFCDRSKEEMKKYAEKN